jgi:hypothetical protein
MSAIVPAGGSGGLSPWQAAQVSRAERRASLEVYRHSLETAVNVEIDRIDSHAIGDVITFATEEELNYLDYGLARANGSAAKAELVARKTNLLSSINNTRISRRFGR